MENSLLLPCFLLSGGPVGLRRLGACEPKLVEPNPLTIGDEYPIQWRRPNLDLTELAKIRWIKRWSVSKLAIHFDRSPETVQMHLCHLRAGKIHKLNFSSAERGTIVEAMRSHFKGASDG